MSQRHREFSCLCWVGYYVVLEIARAWAPKESAALATPRSFQSEAIVMLSRELAHFSATCNSKKHADRLHHSN